MQMIIMIIIDTDDNWKSHFKEVKIKKVILEK